MHKNAHFTLQGPINAAPSCRLATAIATLFMLLLAAVAQAQPLPGQPAERVDFPVTSPGIPAYARLELLIPDFDAPNTEQWAAIVFYRDPECVPDDFDLGQFFHLPDPDGLGAFGCPLLIEGHEIWENGSGTDMAPIYVYSHNAVPDLPVWFVARDELDALLERGFVFIDEIEALPSIIHGRAWRFEESLYPHGSAPSPGITMRAEGRLETGGHFLLEWHFHSDTGEDAVMIELESPAGTHPGPRPVICLIHPELPGC